MRGKSDWEYHDRRLFGDLMRRLSASYAKDGIKPPHIKYMLKLKKDAIKWRRFKELMEDE